MTSQRKVVLFIAASLDGYIATKEDSLEWLFQVEGEGDNGYSEFYETVDTVLLGRRTYDWIMEFEKGKFPYKNKDCYVFTSVPSENNEHVKFVNEPPAEVIEKLKQKDGKDIWLVGGGGLLHSFVNKNLIDEMIVTIAPAIIGLASRCLMRETLICSLP